MGPWWKKKNNKRVPSDHKEGPRGGGGRNLWVWEVLQTKVPLYYQFYGRQEGRRSRRLSARSTSWGNLICHVVNLYKNIPGPSPCPFPSPLVVRIFILIKQICRHAKKTATHPPPRIHRVPSKYVLSFILFLLLPSCPVKWRELSEQFKRKVFLF